MSCPDSGPTWFTISPPSVHINGSSYLTLYAPVQLVYFFTAVLVTIPNTYALRLAVLPASVYFLYQAGIHLDMSNGDPLQEVNNCGLLTLVTIIFMRVITWTFHSKHFLRTSKYKHANERTISQIMFDGADLCFNFRGIGWDWSDRQAVIDHPSHKAQRELSASARRQRFIHGNSVWYFASSALFEIALYIHLNNRLAELDERSLSFLFLRALNSLLYPIMTYSNLSGTYNLYALIGVCICRQDTEQWPPFYNKPWLSTSLTEFWGKRWHQAFRYTFSNVGGKPLSLLFGRAGFVLGTFFASGVFHDMGFWGMRRGRGLCCFTTPYFVLNGVGCVVEAAFRRLTGKKVCGLPGRVWAWSWLVGCGLVTMSPFCTHELLRPFEDAVITQPFYLTYVLVMKSARLCSLTT
ncbi:hypothetical protein CYLTODRAFT_237769 [Cylindrobasidium torrendii FP15055 ss-10]|uniref:Wax synthase domain-containing protein n=1 Tax=Cylindrobasidium torrendii FP15055 ss-10 TaxID=1314674 RepID=A0A0D7BHS7_9AGAR|nr:hypothetical protein CYLTODRAFT_237769 [Cylindrobasidium torrendii FP15055 ss-10]